jgi:hypothetical protein
MRKAGVGGSFRDRYVQDERYFASEHRDVRREDSRGPLMCLASPGTNHPPRRPPLNQAGYWQCLCKFLETTGDNLRLTCKLFKPGKCIPDLLLKLRAGITQDGGPGLGIVLMLRGF